MEVNFSKYRIKLEIEHGYTPGSADNVREYYKIYQVQNDLPTGYDLGITIYEDDSLISSAIIGTSGATNLRAMPVFVEEERIVLCCRERLVCISVPQLEMLWYVQADPAYCFEVFKYGADYIVHGELTISRIDHNGNVSWQQSGADIFTTIEGTHDFALTDEYIFARDWQQNVYKFDYDGNVII